MSFFADDGLMLAHNIEEAKVNLGSLNKISYECALVQLNRRKSNNNIFNMKEQPEDIEGIAITSMRPV